MYHPAKPRQIRVVFECNAKYVKISVNLELMSEPDLNNQTVETLLRFRKGIVAFLADIEAMLYQFQVTEKHRSFLRFLWWTDNNASNDIVDYEMNTHVLGGTSSLS